MQQILLLVDRYNRCSVLGASDKVLKNLFTTISRIQLISLKLPQEQTHIPHQDQSRTNSFLAHEVMEREEVTGKHVIMAWATKCKAKHKDVSYL